MAKHTQLRCFLRSLSNKNLRVELPHNSPVIIGRMPEFQIVDKRCSRNQLELQANYDKRYVLVKRLGPNPSQIDGIEIHRHLSTQLKQGQKLNIVNMNYPYDVVFEDPNEIDCSTNTNTGKVKLSGSKLLCTQRKRTHQNDKTGVENSKISRQHTDPLNCRTVDSQNSDMKIVEQSSESPVTTVNSTTTSLHWSQGLKTSMTNPKFIVYDDKKVVAIKDKYPKAKYHWLVLPHENLSNPYKLTEDHLELVRHILSVGQNLAKAEMAKESNLQFRYGYHAVASMSQLHMHVISQDFNSSCLKTKKHWNSFTTDYFVDAEDIIVDLERDGKVKDRRSFTELLKNQLKCHRCNQSRKNMPELKRHISTCKKS